MPNRIIKESINESQGLSLCSLFAEDLYKRLITYADDYGRFNADTVIMRARLYPREQETVFEEDIVNGLTELAGVGKISFYTPKIFNQFGKTGVYGAFPNWSNHQRVRNSKTKCPDPGDTDVNDWYLRRFIPLEMRVHIIERDGFKCQECGKYVTTCREAKRFVKLGTGLYHIDHLVPVLQGGRATEENLRLLCPECNLKRKKRFSYEEILSFAKDTQAANNCGDSRQSAASCSLNPIQSNTNPNPNPKGNPNTTRARARGTDYTLLDIESLYDGDAALAGATRSWIKYKQERGDPFGDASFAATTSEIKRYAGIYGSERVIDLINHCIASTYTGIIWNALKNAQDNSSNQGFDANEYLLNLINGEDTNDVTGGR